ncbi:MAG: peptidoglycan-binding protein [Tabrizicola sp.]|nr:peptidoglycan-binding protein [Tabrizicola sp.]
MLRRSRLKGLMFLAVVALAAPSFAEEGVLCLQKQLASLNYDPGPLDGKVGPATRRALARFEDDEGLVADRRLDAFSAIIFCHELGLRNPDLAKQWPSASGSQRVEIAGEPDNQLRFVIAQEATAARIKIATLFDVRLAAPVDIVAGSTAREIAESAKPFTESSDGAVDRAAERLCRDAPAYGFNTTYLPGVILFCQRPGAVYHGGFPPRDARNLLGRMLAMEMIFQLTGDPANGSEDEYLRRTGPMWLIVGTMQLLQREVDGATTPLGRQKAVEKLRTEGIRNPRSMEYYLSSLEDPVGIGRTGFLVTDDMTRDTGLSPIGIFYRNLGIGASLDEAFQAAFGKSRTAVYEGYP